MMNCDASTTSSCIRASIAICLAGESAASGSSRMYRPPPVNFSVSNVRKASPCDWACSDFPPYHGVAPSSSIIVATL